jgi:hypothetical protein
VPNDQDPECSKATGPESYAELSGIEDAPNVRCYDQRRRFGLDFLYPVERYNDGLTKREVPNRAGELVENPIFASAPGVPGREPHLVLLAGIVGGPWQDIATSESWNGEGLEYLSARELEEQGRWDVVLGSGGDPTDPLMRESIAERSGVHPLLGLPLAPSTSTNPRENPINGHEHVAPKADDLQYACTFPLATPRPCSVLNDARCDCNADEWDNHRSLCEYAGGPMTDGVQRYAKAYPGVRTLEVLRGVGENAIVASICPKYTEPRGGLLAEEDASYGYNPAMTAIVGVFQDRLLGQCLPRPLPVETDPSSPDLGRVPCAVVEAVPRSEGACSCDETRGRLALGPDDSKLPSAVASELELNRLCGGSTGQACNDFCLCKIAPLGGAALDACHAGSEDPNVYGYCYVDPARGIGDPSLVEGCDESMRRTLRFMGDGLPKNGSVLFTACLGASVSD